MQKLPITACLPSDFQSFFQKEIIGMIQVLYINKMEIKYSYYARFKISAIRKVAKFQSKILPMHFSYHSYCNHPDSSYFQ